MVLYQVGIRGGFQCEKINGCLEYSRELERIVENKTFLYVIGFKEGLQRQGW